MKKILIILSGVLLVYMPLVEAKDLSGIIIAKKVVKAKKTKNAQKKKKTVQKKKKIIKKTTKKVQKKKKIKNKRVRYNVGEIQSYAHQLVIEYGWSESDYQALVLLWYRESGWNPNAYNKSSGACGIPQSKPCSKMAKFGRDYRTNWKVQVRWGLDYIKRRYVTPSEAYRKFLERKPHWY